MSQGTSGSGGGAQVGADGARRSGGRAVVVAVVIAALAVSVVSRNYAMDLRVRGDAATGTGTQVSLARAPSFLLALLLGGLRGPLVMVLWTTSEQQKSERNLEDFDTKVEWIRLLQPEFDSVHIFQVWNKAYNISVQMASLANKYATILDAVDYARSVDAERPNNINVLAAIAQVWFDKLGNSHEKVYYREQVRKDSLDRPVGPGPRRGEPGWRRSRLDPVLDASGNIRPEYLAPTASAPALSGPSPLAPDQYADGSDLQFLKQWQPFPQGVSPLAFGYNYHKRAQVLQSSGRQRHLQLSELVIDSRPALALKSWSEEEWEIGRRNELAAFGAVPDQIDEYAAPKLAFELPTATSSALKDREAAKRAMFNYDLTARLAEASLVEYDRHLQKFRTNFQTYRAHQDLMQAVRDVARADHDYLQALLTTDPAERRRLLAAVRGQYLKAREMFALQAVRYYIDDDIAERFFPAGVTRFTIGPRTDVPDFLTALAYRTDQFARERTDVPDGYAEDRAEYMVYVERISRRLDALGGIK